jgi:hypothetical protein
MQNEVDGKFVDSAGLVPGRKCNGGGVDDGEREFLNLILFVSISGLSKE